MNKWEGNQPGHKIEKDQLEKFGRNGTTGLIAADSLFLDESLKSKVTQDSSANLSVRHV